MPVGVWTLHPRRCADCNHRWHYFGKCHKRLNKFKWQSRVECNCQCSKALSIKEAIQYARSI